MGANKTGPGKDDDLRGRILRLGLGDCEELLGLSGGNCDQISSPEALGDVSLLVHSVVDSVVDSVV